MASTITKYMGMFLIYIPFIIFAVLGTTTSLANAEKSYVQFRQPLVNTITNALYEQLGNGRGNVPIEVIENKDQIEQLLTRIYGDTRFFGMRVTFYDKNGNLLTINNQEISEAFFQEDDYKRYRVIADTGAGGAGSVSLYEESMLLAFQVENEILPGWVELEIVIPQD